MKGKTAGGGNYATLGKSKLEASAGYAMGLHVVFDMFVSLVAIVLFVFVCCLSVL